MRVSHRPDGPVRFLYWQLRSSAAGGTLDATVAGVLIAGLFEVASRVRRWKRGRAATEAARPATRMPGAR